MPPRIAVHTVALNEAKHIKRWAESARDADLLMIADTGSDDGTPLLAQQLGVEVHHIRVRPWRFDVARNAGMALLPDDIDIVIKLDVDEILAPGWREQLEKAVAAYPEARRFSYTYIWNWLEPGVPDVQFASDGTCTRWGWKWHGAVHEVLVPSSTDESLTSGLYPGGFTIEHHADATKSRASYLGLLELAVSEEPHNPRQRFYLGREYFFRNQWVNARRTLVEFLAMPEATWAAERAEAYRYLAKMDDYPERWLLKAIAEAPERRDAVVDLADLYAKEGRDYEAAGMAARALGVTERPGDYMSRAATWDDERLRQMMARGGVFE